MCILAKPKLIGHGSKQAIPVSDDRYTNEAVGSEVFFDFGAVEGVADACSAGIATGLRGSGWLMALFVGLFGWSFVTSFGLFALRHSTLDSSLKQKQFEDLFT